MPAGSKPGERRGGKKRGTKNRKTLERELLAAQAIANAKPAPPGQPMNDLAKEVLVRLMNIAEGAAGLFRPVVDPATGKPRLDDPAWPAFGEWIDRTLACAKESAKYQSPQFRAIVVAPAPDVKEERKRFTLTIFEGGKPTGNEAEILPPPKKKGIVG